MDVKVLVGSGDRIGLATFPFVAAGVVANVVAPEVFAIGGPPRWLATMSVVVGALGMASWLWAVALVVRKVPRHELITTGPFRWMTHPIYTSFALLVLPWVGFLLDTWLGAALGLILYATARTLARAEEAQLAATFGDRWDTYRRSVKLAWL